MKINIENEQEYTEKKEIEQPHSVKFSINAKGHYSAELKVYARTPEEALKEACALAKKVELIISEKNLSRTDRGV